MIVEASCPWMSLAAFALKGTASDQWIVEQEGALKAKFTLQEVTPVLPSTVVSVVVVC